MLLLAFNASAQDCKELYSVICFVFNTYIKSFFDLHFFQKYNCREKKGGNIKMNIIQYSLYNIHFLYYIIKHLIIY